MSSNLLKGTLTLTIGLLLSRVLGVLYIIPFYGMVGEKNIGLYQYAYVVYSIILAVAVSGVPIAVSRFVAKYNALGDYATSRKLLKSSMLLMLITGAVSFLLMYSFAEPIAHMVRKSDEQIFSVAEIAGVIRWVSFAVIVVPAMSLIRGFFQGNNMMMPTAVSQLVEQIARIAFVLGGSWVVVYALHGSQRTAVSFAVFAAFLGALASVAVLYGYWKRSRPEFDRLLAATDPEASRGALSIQEIFKEILIYSVPFALTGVINPVYQFVDMITFNGAMADIGKAALSDTYLTMLNMLTHKIVIIPVMLATGFSMAIIPLITAHYTRGEMGEVKKSLDQTFQILLFLTVPAAIGIALLSGDFYRVFYEPSAAGATVLAHYAPVAILFSLYPVTTAILQGINRQKLIILNLLVGILVKLVLNVPLIHLFETDGAIFATSLGYAASIGLNLACIFRLLDYRSSALWRRLLVIGILNASMAAIVYACRAGIETFAQPSGKFGSLLILAFCAYIGAGVYAYGSLKTGLAERLFGERIERFTKKYR